MAFENWVDAFAEIVDALPADAGLACPNCGERSLRLQYVGDLVTRLGYAALWCDACRHGVTLSRVKAPDSASVLSFDSDPETLKEAIPRYHEVDPDPHRDA